MTHRRYSVITCDARDDHRCWRDTPAYETERQADDAARQLGWVVDEDRGDMCPACQENRR
jgi:hypothetical protein